MNLELIFDYIQKNEKYVICVERIEKFYNIQNI